MTYLDCTVEQAVCALRSGKAVIFPTDTVYGVGVSVAHAESPDLLFDIKQRSHDKPIAWLVSSLNELDRFGQDVPAFASMLARTFWPGPLTLIVRASEAVPTSFHSTSGTIGLRMPRNETALEILNAVGCPIATTSANAASARAPRAKEDIDPSFAQLVGHVVTDDLAKSGVASTILDCTGDHPVMVREGAVTIADIRALG